MRPRVLLVVTNTDWPATALFPEAAAAAGLGVFVFCSSRHLVRHSVHIEELCTYAPPIEAAVFNRQLAALVERWRPDLLLPADDPALWLLHRLRLDATVGPAAPLLAEALDRSLGRPHRLLTLERKSLLPEVARELGLEMAPQRVDPTLAEAGAFAEEHGWPVVVKHDYAWGGLGTRFCRTPDSLRQALGEELKLPHPGPRAVIVARYLAGEAVEVTYSAWKGRLLGVVPLRKVQVAAGGGSAVVERSSLASLVVAAERLVEHFGLSGVGDIEFRVDTATGEPCLIEMNPRLVPTARVAGLFGVDAYGLLGKALRGQVGATVRGERSPRVALFPAEWQRDPSSAHLREDVHDVPWSDPALLVEMMRGLSVRPEGQRAEPLHQAQR